jgi:hypothetical protein
MPFSKLSARTRLEVLLESYCPSFVSECVITHQIPRSVFRSMGRLAGIVIVKARPKVVGLSDIFFIRLV